MGRLQKIRTEYKKAFKKALSAFLRKNFQCRRIDDQLIVEIREGVFEFAHQYFAQNNPSASVAFSATAKIGLM
jgi:hypothetical protein